jgi:hypothetical protein
MEYRIVEEKSQFDLQDNVNKLIKLGWKPQGGVSFLYHSVYNETWAQAMVKE